MSLTTLLSTLMTFKTTDGNRAAMDRLLAWVEKEISAVPLYVRRYDIHGHPALVLTTKRKKSVRLWLVAHIDVVPAPDRLFVPKVRAGKLYGRGAYDMKFAIACYVRLLKELGDSVADYDIGLMLTSDEELGGDSGVRHLLEKEKYTGDVVFLPDGTGAWEFEEMAKGKLTLEVTARGERGHGARPWDGRSAIHELCSYIHDAVDEFRVFEKNDAEHWHTTMHVGTIQGGEAFNTVAPIATAMFDIRYPDAREFGEIQHILTSLHTVYPHTRVRILCHDKPYGLGTSNEFAQMFAQYARIEGRDCGWARAHGSSDARYFNAAHIPTLLISPQGGDAHSDHEWIDLKDLEVYYRVFKKFVMEVARR
jgi:succinyl-diaminopimelate desuccinylase